MMPGDFPVRLPIVGPNLGLISRIIINHAMLLF